MTPAQIERVKEVLFQVGLCAPQDRLTLARMMCRADDEVLMEVESLLRDSAGPPLLPSGGGIEIAREWLGGSDDGALAARRVGRRIQRYEILAVLDAGGMSHVYLARDTAAQRDVALKVIRRHLVSPRLLRRFAHESEFMARLRHPNVAEVFEAGWFHEEDATLPFIAMELIAGASLITAYAQAGQLDIRARVQLMIRVCEGVACGHRAGIIHRDLKPANILVGTDAVPKVIDFGVARAVDPDLAITTMRTDSGQIVGTLQYMSPEQTLGDPGSIDTRTDVYALGVVLYELLCGRLPYSVDGVPLPSAIHRIREERQPPPSSIEPRLRGPLEAIIEKALQKDRSKRYESALELAGDLGACADGRRVQARSPGPLNRTFDWIREHPKTTTAIACSAMLVTSGGSLWLGITLGALEPSGIVIDPARRRAILHSIGGRALNSWDSGVKQGIVAAELIERAQELGGGYVAAIIYGLNTPNGAPGALCVYDIARPDVPLWSTDQLPVAFPVGESGHPEVRMMGTHLLVADVLPSLPGDEIVFVERLDKFAAACIRVFDVAGTTHYLAWHDGPIDSLLWLPAAGQLVFCGLNCEPTWSARAKSFEQAGALYCVVTMGLTPEDGQLHPERWMVREGVVLDPSVRWYKWFGPPDHLAALGHLDASATLAGGKFADGRHAEVTFDGSPTIGDTFSPGIHLTIDENGREISRFPNDAYKTIRQKGLLPDDSAFRLIEYGP